MVSKLEVDALSGVSSAGVMTVVGEGGSTTTNLQQGLCKAWISVSHQLTSINDSFNISSLDDDGTGDGGVHITNDMNSAEYSILTGTDDGASGGSIHSIDITQGTQAAGTYDFESAAVDASTNRTNADTESYHAIQGDLA